ncbi:MAG: hypothetical protein AB7L71_15325 [Vicinamibacterales bacterium]
MRKLTLATALLVTLLVPARAYADVTAFFGVGHRPETRTAKGFAVGLTLIAVGFEIEYSDIKEVDETTKAAPRLRTGTVNAIVQTPTSGAQLYATAGVGLYRENWRSDFQETNTAINVGGGLKMNLLGPLKLRVDYRLFRLNGAPIEKTVHRVYGGVNASF